ncbi:MAG: class I SAM-dependent methyltransferase [Candidatus Dormibacteria bacterium]
MATRDPGGANSVEKTAQAVFGERAGFYSTSPTHADPKVLARVVDLASPIATDRVLDVGTGTGHTAFAMSPRVRAVVGVDITQEMLSEAERLRDERGLGNVAFRIADAHELPFPDSEFQVVTCRRAAHHFSDLPRALAEMRRVLSPGGRLVIDDRSVPEDDEVDVLMNRLDVLHDASHVRELRARQWHRTLEAAGFDVYTIEEYIQHRPLRSLTEGVSGADVERLHALLEAADSRVRLAIDLREVNGETHSNHFYVLLAARRS